VATLIHFVNTEPRTQPKSSTKPNITSWLSNIWLQPGY